MHSKVQQNKVGENGYCRNYVIKQSFCHTFLVIPKGQNYREIMYGDKKSNRCGYTGHFYPSKQLFYNWKLHLVHLTDISQGKVPWICKKDQTKPPYHLKW